MYIMAKEAVRFIFLSLCIYLFSLFLFENDRHADDFPTCYDQSILYYVTPLQNVFLMV
jgi:hypothetical protein